MALLLPPPALAQNTITNVMSAVASYQYPEDIRSEGLTNGGLGSLVASYQYPECFASEALTNGGLVTPIASYQYWEWPGSGSLNLVSSRRASYWYAYVDGPVGVSANLSQVLVSTNSVPADGQSAATVTVTLLDGLGNPVTGKRVSIAAVEQLSSGGLLTLSTVTQPANTTDTNGQARATLTSTTAGTAIIWAQDTTDGIGLAAQPTVQFTPVLVIPSAALSNAIVSLAADTTNCLGNAIASVAIDEGKVGDKCEALASAERREQAVAVVSTFVGAALDLSPADGDVLEDVKLTLGLTIVAHGASWVLDAIVSNSTALATYGEGIASTNRTLAGSAQQQGQSLLAGIPPVSASMTAALTNDLGLRLQANEVLNDVLGFQDARLDTLQASLVSSSGRLAAFLTVVDVIGDVVHVTVNVVAYAASVITGEPGPLVVGVGVNEALDAGEGLLTLSLDQHELAEDQKCYDSALCSLWSCSALSGAIYRNTASGFAGIAQGRVPNPVTGKILEAKAQQLGFQLSINSGAWRTSTESSNATATLLTIVTGAYSTITLTNTGAQPAAFSVHALYSYSNNVYGTPLALPAFAGAATNLSVGGTAQVRIDYSPSQGLPIPDAGTQVTIYALGWNNQGVYYVDSNSPTVLAPSGITLLRTQGNPRGPSPKDGSLTNSVTIENPIRSYVFQNLTNQTYEAQIWVENPFVIPLLATVTQPLPSGVTVLATDGTLQGSSIVWANLMPSNSVAEMTFSFRASTVPGGSTNLPAPTLLFTDLMQTNSVSSQAAPAGFKGLYPVAVSGSVPAGVSGMDAPMPVAVTNWTSTNQSGVITIVVSDSSGVQVGNYTLPFSVAGLGNTNLALMLPGSLPPGSYAVIGMLSIGGGGGPVIAGMYTVAAAPVTLAGAAVGGALSNGFTLELQGAPGSGYLIEASTNLVNWQPLQYVVAGSSPTYYTDYYAPYYNQRFYRAVPVGQVAPPVAPQLASPVLLPGGALQVTLYGAAGQSYTMQASTNLVDWVAVTNLALPDGWGQFTDYGATNYSRRFYRAVAP